MYLKHTSHSPTLLSSLPFTFTCCFLFCLPSGTSRRASPEQHLVSPVWHQTRNSASSQTLPRRRGMTRRNAHISAFPATHVFSILRAFLPYALPGMYFRFGEKHQQFFPHHMDISPYMFVCHSLVVGRLLFNTGGSRMAWRPSPYRGDGRTGCWSPCGTRLSPALLTILLTPHSGMKMATGTFGQGWD